MEKFGRDELVRGSFVLLVMVNLYNILNQLFHLFMARFLGPIDYGILTVLFSIIYIIAIPSEAVQNVIAAYTNQLTLKKEDGKIKFMLFKSLKKGFLISTILFIFYILLALFLSYFLKIEYWLFIITGILIFTIFPIPTLRGIILGKKKFVSLGVNMVLEGFIKISMGIILVILGLKVYGAIFAVMLGTFISFFLAFFLIRDILREKIKEEKFKKIYSYSLPYFISIISIALISSLDVIFARKFFSPETAGIYSAASTLGKIIFFGILAISKVMLPLTSEKYHNGEKTTPLLRKSLGITFFISLIILLFYLLMPSIIIKILFGIKYISAEGILFLVGLGFSFLSFTNIVILYGLLTNKIKKSSFTLFFFILLEILLFYLFHESITEYAASFLITNFLMFIYSLFLIRR